LLLGFIIPQLLCCKFQVVFPRKHSEMELSIQVNKEVLLWSPSANGKRRQNCGAGEAGGDALWMEHLLIVLLWRTLKLRNGPSKLFQVSKSLGLYIPFHPTQWMQTAPGRSMILKKEAFLSQGDFVERTDSWVLSAGNIHSKKK
jgi:hypothetical protein